MSDNFEERRQHARHPLMTFFWLSAGLGKDYRVHTRDVSAGGFSGWTRAPIKQGQELSVSIGGVGIVRATVVWTDSGYFGAQLQQTINPDAVDLSDIRLVRDMPQTRKPIQVGEWS